jgi:hypothetical protein
MERGSKSSLTGRMSSGNRCVVFLDDEDRHRYRRLLREMHEPLRSETWAYLNPQPVFNR